MRCFADEGMEDEMEKLQDEVEGKEHTGEYKMRVTAVEMLELDEKAEAEEEKRKKEKEDEEANRADEGKTETNVNPLIV